MQEVKRVIVLQKVDGEDRDALGEIVECAALNGEISRAIAKVTSTLVKSPPSHIVAPGSRRCNFVFPSNGDGTTRPHPNRRNHGTRLDNRPGTTQPGPLQGG